MSMRTPLKAGKVGEYISRLEYSIRPYLRFLILRTETGWMLGEDVLAPIRLLTNEKRPSEFNTLEEAQGVLEQHIQYLYTPLTRKEIITYFNMAWIRKEEDTKGLLAFREALLAANYKRAIKLFEGMGNYTREAIPSKVVFQLELNHPGE